MCQETIVNTMFITKNNSRTPIVIYNLGTSRKLNINMVIQLFKSYPGKHNFDFIFYDSHDTQFYEYHPTYEISIDKGNEFALEIGYYASFDREELPKSNYIYIDVTIDGKGQGRLYLYLFEAKSRER